MIRLEGPVFELEFPVEIWEKEYKVEGHDAESNAKDTTCDLTSCPVV